MSSICDRLKELIWDYGRQGILANRDGPSPSGDGKANLRAAGPRFSLDGAMFQVRRFGLCDPPSAILVQSYRVKVG